MFKKREFGVSQITIPKYTGFGLFSSSERLEIIYTLIKRHYEIIKSVKNSQKLHGK